MKQTNLENYNECPDCKYFEKKIDKLEQKICAMNEEIDNLKTVMVAAAEEIQAHWKAHCDEEGYGPSNLMHRLENGIGAKYSGYSSGAFALLQEQVKNLENYVSKENGAV